MSVPIRLWDGTGFTSRKQTVSGGKSYAAAASTRKEMKTDIADVFFFFFGASAQDSSIFSTFLWRARTSLTWVFSSAFLWRTQTSLTWGFFSAFLCRAWLGIGRHSGFLREVEAGISRHPGSV